MAVEPSSGGTAANLDRIVFIEGDDGLVDVCEDLKRALVEMEGYDVLDGVWSAWDAKGRMIRLAATTEDGSGPVAGTRTDRIDEDGLKAALVKTLDPLASETDRQTTQSADLESLVRLATAELPVLTKRRPLHQVLLARLRSERLS